MIKSIITLHQKVYQQDPSKSGWGLHLSTLFLFSSLFFLYYTETGEMLHHTMNRGVTTLSAHLLTLLGFPNSIHDEVIIRFPFTSYSIIIVNSCNGLLMMVLLSCAVLGVPCSKKDKIAGVFLFCGAMMLLNLVRIVSIIILNFYSPSVADFFHKIGWNILFVLLLSFLWIRWMKKIAARSC